MAKTRAAPLKYPHLELMAALTAHIWQSSSLTLCSFTTAPFLSGLTVKLDPWQKFSSAVCLFLSKWDPQHTSVSFLEALLDQWQSSRPPTRGITYDQSQSSLIWLNGLPWLPSENLRPKWKPADGCPPITCLISGSWRDSSTSYTKQYSHGRYRPPLYHWCFRLQKTISSPQCNSICVSNTRKPSIR